MDHIGRKQNSDSQHDRPPRELQQAGLGAALGGVRGGVGCAALVLEPKGDSLWEVMDSLYDEERKKVLAKAERRLHKYNVNAWEFCVRKTMKAKLMKAATAVREAAKAGHQQIEMKPDVWLKDACRGTGYAESN
eukprot:g9034.t1